MEKKNKDIAKKIFLMQIFLVTRKVKIRVFITTNSAT